MTQLAQLFYISGRRFIKEKYSTQAAALTFYTIFALIPLVALALAFVGKISIIPEQEARIQDFFLNHFVPPFTEQIKHDIILFLAASRKLSQVSSIIFLLTAVFLVRNVQSIFNHIWHARRRHESFLHQFVHYFMVLVVAPFALGISVALSALLLSSGLVKDPLLLSGLSTLIKMLPFVFTWLGIAVLYFWLPQAKVNLKHALISSFVVAILFETMKYGISMYVFLFPTYEVVYGALSVLLILFLWIYMSWLAILWGAVFASEMPD